jgi:hypothetical protein
MKRLIVLLGVVLALTFVAGAGAETITLSFSGTIDRVVDEGSVEKPINFTPIPVGSSFNGVFTYNSNAPQTGGGTGVAAYYDLAPANGSVTINGFTFATTNPGFANPFLQVISKEIVGDIPSGVAIGTQPILLPVGWGVEQPSWPYFTAQFFDETRQSRSLALPVAAADFPLGNDHLFLDFQQPVTLGGETFGGNVNVIGNITSLTVNGVTVPEPDSLTLSLLSLAGLLAAWLTRRCREVEAPQTEFPPAVTR